MYICVSACWHVEAWLDKARRLRARASALVGEGEFDFACFAAQQSAEFLLKGLLVGRLGARPITNSLYQLAKAWAEASGALLREEVVRCAKELEQHYVQARYPDARLTPYEEWEAERCLRCLGEIWSWAVGSE